MEIDTNKNFSSFQSSRRFGVEIEINAFDLLSKPLNDKNFPNGIEFVACEICNEIKVDVVITKWQNDHYNSCWGIKPDSSCGMEIVSPVLRGIHGIEQVCEVVKLIRKNNYSVDKRCSVHVHVDVSDLSDKQLTSIITWWIKCEPVFFDSVLSCRKLNPYCMFIGLNSAFRVDKDFYSLEQLNDIFGKIKYYSLNTYHKNNKKRNTIEFRIMDYDACKNIDDIRNWIKIILHFCECAVNQGMPLKYKEQNFMTGYHWLDPHDVFEFLKINNNSEVSDELNDIKKWFATRIIKNSIFSNILGFPSMNSRLYALEEVKSMI